MGMSALAQKRTLSLVVRRGLCGGNGGFLALFEDQVSRSTIRSSMAAAGLVGLVGLFGTFGDFLSSSFSFSVSNFPSLNGLLGLIPIASLIVPNQLQSQTQNKTCTGTARVLGGNPNTIGKPGGLGGATVGDILVTAGSAAIDPFQFQGGKAAIRTVRNQISGITAGGQTFIGISDVIGGPVPFGFSNVRDYLRSLNPGALLIELISGTDEGTASITLTIPNSMACPSGTSLATP